MGRQYIGGGGEHRGGCGPGRTRVCGRFSMDDESLATFCAITGASETDAQYYLEAAGAEVEVAVGLYMDGGKRDKSPSMGAAHADADMPDAVRQPIAPSRGVLVDDGGHGGQSHWVDPAQARRSIGMSPFASFADSADTSTERGRRLAELFKRPEKIMFVGTFEGARSFAKGQARYLLVSLHDNTEFRCQMLNRDLWNKPDVQEFVLDNLIYMQLTVGTEEADRFMRFYQFHAHPHIALIDPRTGKAVRTWQQQLATHELIGETLEYIEDHPIRAHGSGGVVVARGGVIDDNDGSDDVVIVCGAVAADRGGQAVAVEAIPEEPAPGAADATVLQFRMPDGSRVRRRFLLSQPVAALFAFAAAALQRPVGDVEIREHDQPLAASTARSLQEANLKNASLNITLRL